MVFYGESLRAKWAHKIKENDASTMKECGA